MNFKKVSSLILVLTVILSSFCMAPLTVGATTTEISSDNFNEIDISPIWAKTVSSGTITTKDYPSITDRSMAFERVSDSSATSLLETYTSNFSEAPNLTATNYDKVVVSAKMACTSSLGGAYMTVTGTNGVTDGELFHIYFGTNEEKEGYATGINLANSLSTNASSGGYTGTYTNLMPTYTSGQFYDIGAVIDLKTNKLDVYIDGVKKVTGADTITSNNTNLSKVLFGLNIKGYSPVEGIKNLYINDYKVSITNDTTPIIESATAYGTANVNNTLTGYYTYSGILEGASEFSWLVSDTADGNYTNIPNQTSKTLLLTSDYVGKYIKFNVTPKDVENVVGIATQSQAVGPITQTNNVPTISEVYPLANSNFDAGETVKLSCASVVDLDNDVTKVEYFDNDKKIAESTTAPYNSTFVITEGNHNISAKVTDSKGAFSQTLTSNISAFVKVFNEIIFESFTTPTELNKVPSYMTSASNAKNGRLENVDGKFKISMPQIDTYVSNSTPYIGISYETNPKTGIIAWDMDVTIDNLDYIYDIYRIRYSGTYQPNLISIIGGKLIINDRTNYNERTFVQDILPDEEYKLRMVINLDTQMVDLYVDGVKKASQVYLYTLQPSDVYLPFTRTNVNRGTSSEYGSLLIDNYALYQVVDNKVSSASVTYSDSSNVTTLKNGETITANVTVVSNTDSAATVVAVLYNPNGTINKITQKSLNFSSNTTQTSANLITELPADVTGYKYKIFVFNSISGLTPVAFDDTLTYLNTGIVK